MTLHGWILDVGISVEYGITYNLYTTMREGILSVESQIAKDWEWERKDFRFGDDLIDYTGLQGAIAFAQTNIKKPLHLARLGKHSLAGDFIFCGLLDDEPIPFHNEEQAGEIMRWFISKQEQWHAIYTKTAYGSDEEGPEGQKANASPGSQIRSGGQVVH